MTTYISTRYTCRLYLHLTLYTKAMASLLTGDVGKALEGWQEELGRSAGVKVHKMAAEADRVHLLVEFASGKTIGEIVSALHRDSARLLRQHFSAWFADVAAIWEKGYAARTAGIPYIPLRALAPIAAWRAPSELESLAQFQPSSGPSDLKVLAKACAKPNAPWRQ